MGSMCEATHEFYKSNNNFKNSEKWVITFSPINYKALSISSYELSILLSDLRPYQTTIFFPKPSFHQSNSLNWIKYSLLAVKSH
jgi:hypothetical protein